MDTEGEALTTNQQSMVHPNLLDDGLDFFCGHMPVQNFDVHEKHIFVSFFGITGDGCGGRGDRDAGKRAGHLGGRGSE